MRTIKFRGKRLKDSKWVYGIPIETHIGIFIVTEENPHICSEYGYMEIDEFDKVYPDTVGQFTGMLDKNSKEIYEGDIVKYYDDIEDELVIRPVEYLNDYCAFCAVHTQKDPDGLFAQWQYEVIGNIHENSD